MKHLVSFLLAITLICAFNFCHAEDWSSYTLEELYSIRDEINSEIGKRLAESVKDEVSSNTSGKIKDIFPDEALATIVRDAVGKLSIEQTVTQEELDRIKFMQISYSAPNGAQSIKDLTGIGRLHNLHEFFLFNGMKYEGTSLPEEFYTLENLEVIDFSGPLTELSPLIGNLVKLRSLELSNTDVSELPITIGNLTNLKTLNLRRTKITELPEAICNLTNLE